MLWSPTLGERKGCAAVLGAGMSHRLSATDQCLDICEYTYNNDYDSTCVNPHAYTTLYEPNIYMYQCMIHVQFNLDYSNSRTKGTTGSKYKKRTRGLFVHARCTLLCSCCSQTMATGASSSAQGSKKHKRAVLSIKRIIEMLDKCGFGVVNGGMSVIQTFCLSEPLD